MVNIFAVIGAAVAALAFGHLWYSRFLFGKTWMKLTRLKPKKDEMWKSVFMAFGKTLVMSYILALFLGYLDVTTYTTALTVAMLAWLGFVGTTSFSSVIWGKKSIKLWILDNGYNIFSMLIMAVILVAWV